MLHWPYEDVDSSEVQIFEGYLRGGTTASETPPRTVGAEMTIREALRNMEYARGCRIL